METQKNVTAQHASSASSPSSTGAAPASSERPSESSEHEIPSNGRSRNGRAAHAETEGHATGNPAGTGNNVRKLRTEQMMSKAELARRAGVSTLTIDRVERGLSCRMDTKRKVLEALGLKPQDRLKVFGPGSDDE